MEGTLNIILENPISGVFIGMILIGISVVGYSLMLRNKKKDTSKEPINVAKDVVDLENLDEIKNDIFNLYKDVEIAKMKFRFSVLEDKLSKSLYTKCEKELSLLKTSHQKMVATDIVLEEIKILSNFIKEDIQKFDVYLHVSQYDYVVDKENKVIRGTDNDRYQIEYKMVIEKNLKTQQYLISKEECVGKWIKK